jgi:uncharacterized protein (DUF1778 family)
MLLSYTKEFFMSASSSVLSVRLSPPERDLLQSAASNAHTSISDFVRRKALEAAEMEVFTNPVIEIPAENWAAIEAWVDAPARDIPELRRLMSRPPVWRD